MLKLASRFGLMSALLIGLTPLPARSDSFPAQGGSQGIVINGNNNQVTQVINQTIINRPNNSRPNWWNKEDKDKKYKHKHKHKHHRRPHGDGGRG
jgi:hypothetical protein